MDTISKKMQVKIENIKYLQNKLMSWKDHSEEELSLLLQNFEKTPRYEVSTYFEEFFTKIDFAKTLLNIANTYKENTKIQINIISSLGNMISRYNLKELPEIYTYFKNNAYQKGISIYVARHLTHLAHFKKEENPWEYFMQIKKMSPKKIAEQKFVSIVEQNINEIPNIYKEEIITFLGKKQETANNEGGKKYYQDLITKIAQ